MMVYVLMSEQQCEVSNHGTMVTGTHSFYIVDVDVSGENSDSFDVINKYHSQ